MKCDGLADEYSSSGTPELTRPGDEMAPLNSYNLLFCRRAPYIHTHNGIIYTMNGRPETPKWTTCEGILPIPTCSLQQNGPISMEQRLAYTATVSHLRCRQSATYRSACIINLISYTFWVVCRYKCGICNGALCI